MTEIMEKLRFNQKKVEVESLRKSEDFFMVIRVKPNWKSIDGSVSLTEEEFIDLAEQFFAEYYKIKRKNKYIDMPVCFLPGKRIFIVMSLYQELAWGDSGHPKPAEKEALNRLVAAKGTKEDLLLIRSMLENRKKWGLVSMVDNFFSQENIE